jgi:lysophospholipase L1-like esterase
MAALGDSITLAFGTCLLPTTCQRNSWSTGGGTRVKSHYKRILAANPAIRDNAHTYAGASARVSGLADQARRAAEARVEYVTILIGANDACHGNIGEMTALGAFRSGLEAALDILTEGLPEARILVASLPDIYQLWEIGHTNRVAVTMWSAGICPALLANPTSTAQPDAARRAAFRERITAYNTQLAAACAAHHPQCKDDGGAVHRTKLTLDMFNGEDFFHPSAKGQNALATATYPDRFTW